MQASMFFFLYYSISASQFPVSLGLKYLLACIQCFRVSALMWKLITSYQIQRRNLRTHIVACNLYSFLMHWRNDSIGSLKEISWCRLHSWTCRRHFILLYTEINIYTFCSMQTDHTWLIDKIDKVNLNTSAQKFLSQSYIKFTIILLPQWNALKSLFLGSISYLTLIP